MAITVYLPKAVPGESLEKACIDAAEKLGYKAKSKDEFFEDYHLGSVHNHKVYYETNIRIGNLLPALHVRGIRKGKEQNYFFIWKGFPLGFASEKKVEEYLRAVSESLGFQDT